MCTRTSDVISREELLMVASRIGLISVITAYGLCLPRELCLENDRSPPPPLDFRVGVGYAEGPVEACGNNVIFLPLYPSGNPSDLIAALVGVRWSKLKCGIIWNPACVRTLNPRPQASM